MKILVLGGTRFFGRHLVNDLLKRGDKVFVFSRGNQKLEFDQEVTFIKGDRKKEEDLKKVLAFGPFDIVYDQICMQPSEAKLLCDILNGHMRKFVFTSTGSVYDFKNNSVQCELDFDPSALNLKFTDQEVYDYQYAKRMAEAIYLKELSCPVVMARFSLVIGNDDYTNRLKFHVDKIYNEEEIYLPRLESKLCFVDSRDAGEFLSFIGKTDYTGPINVVARGSMSIGEIIARIEKKLNKKAKIVSVATKENSSQYGTPVDFMMDNFKAESLGFKFKNLEQLIDGLIQDFINENKKMT